MPDSSNQTIPDTESVHVARIAVAWEITSCFVRTVAAEDGTVEERATKLAKLFVQTLKEIS